MPAWLGDGVKAGSSDLVEDGTNLVGAGIEAFVAVVDHVKFSEDCFLIPLQNHQPTSTAEGRSQRDVAGSDSLDSTIQSPEQSEPRVGFHSSLGEWYVSIQHFNKYDRRWQFTSCPESRRSPRHSPSCHTCRLA